MFDPHDFTYKDLSDSFRDFNSEDMLFTNAMQNQNRDTQFTQNKPGPNEIYFNNDPFSNETINDIENTELVVIHSEDVSSYEPILLDENTVNQFLIPTPKIANNDNQNEGDNNIDLLALQSCVNCQQIFTSDADLLEHMISVHASDEAISRVHNLEKLNTTESSKSTNDNFLDLETEWLVCCQCERVLSIALDMDPTDQLCCANINEKCGVAKQKLNTMYVCDFCSGLFANDESLDKHKAVCNMNNYTEDINSSSISSEVYLQSTVCDKQTGSSDEMTLSKNTYQEINFAKSRKYSTNTQYNNSPNSKMWNCGSCNQLFVTARELYRHKRGEDRPEGAPITAYVCEECDKVLGSMCALHTHKKMHKVSKPGYPCRICGRRFNQSGHLAIHMRMHTGERPYPCDLCPKAFKVKVERDDHRRTHTGERPFACTACPKTFTAAARLREHARIHTDQRPYRCEICGAAFRRPYARTVHTLIHTGEKPHECDVCGTAFRRSGDMWKHKRTIHGTHVTDGKSS